MIVPFIRAHHSEAVSKNEANINSCDYYHMEEVIHEAINTKLHINSPEHLLIIRLLYCRWWLFQSGLTFIVLLINCGEI